MMKCALASRPRPDARAVSLPAMMPLPAFLRPLPPPAPKLVLPVLALLLALPALALPRAAIAAEPCAPACPSPSCAAVAARCLLAAGQPEEARDLLRPFVSREPDRIELRLLLARAYWALGNMAWARRTLGQAAEDHPGSCEVRSWLIWLHLQGAELDSAEALLGESGCPNSAAMQGRWRLLEATLARFREETGPAREALAQAEAQRGLIVEDHELLADLRSRFRPGEPPALRLRFELGGGYTSNGLMSSPAEVGAGARQETASPALLIDAQARFEPPWGARLGGGTRLRPLLELGVRGLVLTSDNVSDHSFYSFNMRPGVAVGPVRLLYAGQLLLLAGGDEYTAEGRGPRWFYETHRAELEWEPAPWLTLFGGSGRSIFREVARTRTEVDGGGAISAAFGRARLLAGASLRGHIARNAAYDLFGGMALASLTRPLGRLSGRARLILSADYYPRSAGYFDSESNRRDLLLKGAGELWSPSWRGARAGLTYEVSGRFSTVDIYEYVDHRLLLRASFSLDLDPWLPRRLRAGPGHVALPYGLARGQGLEDERIQDLLRQEDAARRGSSCVN